MNATLGGMFLGMGLCLVVPICFLLVLRIAIWVIDGVREANVVPPLPKGNNKENKLP